MAKKTDYQLIDPTAQQRVEELSQRSPIDTDLESGVLNYCIEQALNKGQLAAVNSLIATKTRHAVGALLLKLRGNKVFTAEAVQQVGNEIVRIVSEVVGGLPLDEETRYRALIEISEGVVSSMGRMKNSEESIRLLQHSSTSEVLP